MKLPVNLLLVEDNPDHAALVITELKKHPALYEIETTTSGKECLKRVLGKKFDTVLLDYSLPQMNGLQIIDKMNENGCETPVILMIEEGVEEIAMEAMKKGVYDHVIKTVGYLNNLSVIISIAIEKRKMAKEKQKLEVELKKLSITDDLSGLFNRRHFYDKLEEEMVRAKRQKLPLSLLLLDIDGFKAYNDQYGHLKGDELITGIGRIITRHIREKVDSGFRYGGDEFTATLPGANLKQSCQIAERIRQSMEEAESKKITLSIGLAEYDFKVGVNIFVKMADDAMYIAKRSGGNRIHLMTNNA